MPADSLTKALPHQKHQEFVRQLEWLVLWAFYSDRPVSTVGEHSLAPRARREFIKDKRTVPALRRSIANVPSSSPGAANMEYSACTSSCFPRFEIGTCLPSNYDCVCGASSLASSLINTQGPADCIIQYCAPAAHTQFLSEVAVTCDSHNVDIRSMIDAGNPLGAVQIPLPRSVSATTTASSTVTRSSSTTFATRTSTSIFMTTALLGPPPTDSPESTTPSKSKGLPPGALGGIIGGILLLLFLLFGAYVLYRYRGRLRLFPYNSVELPANEQGDIKIMHGGNGPAEMDSRWMPTELKAKVPGTSTDPVELLAKLRESIQMVPVELPGDEGMVIGRAELEGEGEGKLIRPVQLEGDERKFARWVEVRGDRGDGNERPGI
ncbi:hypothetical protein P154DRAFT_624277 [Amniculicola lignicola CBS 123094]|uniref:Extracellular membrane protein CFEM domain-containing protein n=1 Tax=Amniculicola lignicola CBS 123094 TaxID=1392246 RepID=A0A6A5VZ76_9PLEO|nr:hypothetical protein P154DRAFT_624277 [Amniculicola lignicola CBS 123094]